MRLATLFGCAMLGCSSDYITSDGGVDVTMPDAGNDGPTCVPVNVSPSPPIHGGTACVADAGTCSPGDMTLFNAGWIPPANAAYPGKCTNGQITEFYNSCITPGPCSTFIAQNSTCFSCLDTTITASAWGPLVVARNGASFLLNFGGCLSRVEPCNQGCAQAIEDQLECIIDSCETGAGCADAGLTDILACHNQAPTCSACTGYTDSVNACVSEMNNDGSLHPALTACSLSGSSLQANYTAVATVMCGPHP